MAVWTDDKGNVNDWDAANDTPSCDAATASHFPPMPLHAFDVARADLLGEPIPARVGQVRTYKGTALVLALCFLVVIIAAPPIGLMLPWMQAAYGFSSAVVISALARMFWFAHE